jgi:hypothetical protein
VPRVNLRVFHLQRRLVIPTAVEDPDDRYLALLHGVRDLRTPLVRGSSETRPMSSRRVPRCGNVASPSQYSTTALV